ncbi:MAG: hypothetical protein KJ726_01095 [Verrucomicrobia bacterium]|nr:hypothetical protein [Verrucomicrobiota bacterium]MBU1908626.1 hypothetical protein [Verrucomicrobiota bacterium]
MDYFSPQKNNTNAPEHREPEDDFSRSSVNKWYLLLAGLVIAGTVIYGVRRWKQRQEESAPTAEKKPSKTASLQVFVGDTRERIVEVLGRPPGVSVIGRKELLIYSNGQVVIENGIAVSVEIGPDRQVGAVQNEGAQIILREGGQIQKQNTRSP